jgi:hypothetical protein
MLYEKDTSMSYEDDTCTSYEEEDTCMAHSHLPVFISRHVKSKDAPTLVLV